MTSSVVMTLDLSDLASDGGLSDRTLTEGARSEGAISEGMVTRLEWTDETLPPGLLMTLAVTLGVDNNEGDLGRAMFAGEICEVE